MGVMTEEVVEALPAHAAQDLSRLTWEAPAGVAGIRVSYRDGAASGRHPRHLEATVRKLLKPRYDGIECGPSSISCERSTCRTATARSCWPGRSKDCWWISPADRGDEHAVDQPGRLRPNQHVQVGDDRGRRDDQAPVSG